MAQLPPERVLAWLEWTQGSQLGSHRREPLVVLRGWNQQVLREQASE